MPERLSAIAIQPALRGMLLLCAWWLMPAAADAEMMPVNRDTPTTAPSALNAAVTERAGGSIADVKVRIVGRQATSARLVQRSLRTEAGQPFDPQLFQNDLQRIRNYEVFRSVTGNVSAADPLTVDVVVEDRWTIIPVFRPTAGAGIAVIKLGIRDSNFLGRNQDLALFAGPFLSDVQNSYVAGFEWTVRQFAGKHQLVSSGGRDFFVDSYYSYSTGASLSDVRVETVQGDSMFWLQRFDFQRVPVFPGAGLYVFSREYTLLAGAAPADGIAPPSAGIRPRLALRVGRVDYAQYRYTGADLLLAGYRQVSLKGTPGFWGGEVEGRLFLRPLERLNLAFRLRADARSNVHSADDVTYGGLDRVRGMPFNWLRGTRAALLNNEARVLIHDRAFDLLFLQGVVLYDVAVAAGSVGTEVAQTAGLGLRAAVIPVYGMFFRIDLAHSLTNTGTGFDIGIGIREFF